MIDELVENIEAYLLLNQLRDMSAEIALNYIKMSVKVYKEQKHETRIKERRYIQTNSSD